MPHPGSNEASALRGGALQIWTKNVAGKAGKGNSYRAVIGFCRKRLHQGPGCTERFPASFLWWRMAYRACAGHRQQILPWRRRILGLLACQGPGCTERASRLLFCGEGWLIGRAQGTGATGLSGDLATQNALPGFFSVVKGSLQGVSGAQVKSPTEAQ